MYGARDKRKWASKSRIGAYIRGEIKLEDMMHPSKIVKPKERHNRRAHTIFTELEANRTTLLGGERIVVHKDVESKIRPYIAGLKTVKDMMHPSKLSTRVNISSQALPAFLQLVNRRNLGPHNALMYHHGGSAQPTDSPHEPSASTVQTTNFRNLLTILESSDSGGGGGGGGGGGRHTLDDAVIRIKDGANRRYVTVVVTDQRCSIDGQTYADAAGVGANRMLSLIAKAAHQGGDDEEINLVDNGDQFDVDARFVTALVDGEYFARLTKSLGATRGDDRSPNIVTSSPSATAFSERSQDERNMHHNLSPPPLGAVFDDNIFGHKNTMMTGHWAQRQQRSDATETCHRNRRNRNISAASNVVTDQPAHDVMLVTELYRKIRTLLEERVASLAYSQQQFDKMETLQTENHHLRAVMARIGEKLKDIENNVDSFSARRVNGEQVVGLEPSSYQEKLKAHNQHLLKTIASMNTYLLSSESKCCAESEERTRQRDATAFSLERYKNLYEKEVKNFKRHKRKCEAHHRHLIQSCNQLHQRIQELDNQNLEMAAKLSYVPVKIQLACRQYQDIIKKLNDDLNCIRSLERKSKSKFIHDKSYPKHFTWR